MTELIRVEGYSAFAGWMLIRWVGRSPERIYGDWLYKPETGCWYCRGHSYPAEICQILEEEDVPMNKVGYEERCKVYMNALIANGDMVQMTKAVEELGECIQAISKVMLGGEDFDHLAEEVADATIMLEQMRLMFNINDRVCEYMDAKVMRLDKNLREGPYGSR